MLPGRLCKGWGSGPVVAAEGRGDEADGRPGAGGGVVEGGADGGDTGLGGAGLVGGVTVVGGLEGAAGGGEHRSTPLFGPDDWLPSVMVTSLSVRFTLAAHVQRLQDAAPCPMILAPLPFTISGVVTTGKPLPPVEVAVRRDGIGASGCQIDGAAAAGVGLVDRGDETCSTSAWSRAGYVHRHRGVGETGREDHDRGESTSQAREHSDSERATFRGAGPNPGAAHALLRFSSQRGHEPPGSVANGPRALSMALELPEPDGVGNDGLSQSSREHRARSEALLVRPPPD